MCVRLRVGQPMVVLFVFSNCICWRFRFSRRCLRFGVSTAVASAFPSRDIYVVGDEGKRCANAAEELRE